MSRAPLVLLLVACVACGGAPFAPFTGPPSDAEPSPDAASSDAAPLDARAPELDAVTFAPDAGPSDVAASDASPDVCAPVAWHTPQDGSTQGPFVGCQVNESPAQLLPGSYAVQNYAGCFLATTPLACRCAATYSCACLVASGATFCTGDHLLACDDSAGAPIITCN